MKNKKKTLQWIICVLIHVFGNETATKDACQNLKIPQTASVAMISLWDCVSFLRMKMYWFAICVHSNTMDSCMAHVCFITIIFIIFSRIVTGVSSEKKRRLCGEIEIRNMWTLAHLPMHKRTARIDIKHGEWINCEATRT